MDLGHDWKSELRRLVVEDAAAGDASLNSTATDDSEDEVNSKPGSLKWNSEPEADKWLADRHLSTADATVAYRIQGWLAERGTSVWFGAGSTGKTQLMLWMAAMIASHPRDRPEQTWLGGRVNGTGHVLILTAEDTREQIIGRLRDVVTHSLNQDEAARLRTCARLHVMPFLSMPEGEFEHPNPSLLEQARDKPWGPSEVLLEIRRYIAEWNRLHPAVEDRIVGVVMDSATSMAGFDSLDAQATTNFFFYLGRLCERLRIFWAVIGHTPKTTSVPRTNARATAASRLRGVAMWTTAPRLTVEVRLIQEWRERGRVHLEAPGLRAWLGGRVDREDLLVVYVAKANLKGASRDERYLVRLPRGAFADVTGQPDDVLDSGVLDFRPNRAGDDVSSDQSPAGTDPTARSGRGPAPHRAARASRTGRPKLVPEGLAPGTDLVRELVTETYAGSGPGRRVSANQLTRVVAGLRATDGRASLVTSASGGGKLPARPGAINWHLDRLAAAGLLEKSGRYYRTAPAATIGEVTGRTPRSRTPDAN